MIRNAIASCLAIGLAVAFLVHFSLIICWGQVLIQEPNPVVLWLEVAGLVGILGFSVWDLIQESKK